MNKSKPVKMPYPQMPLAKNAKKASPKDIMMKEEAVRVLKKKK